VAIVGWRTFTSLVLESTFFVKYDTASAITGAVSTISSIKNIGENRLVRSNYLPNPMQAICGDALSYAEHILKLLHRSSLSKSNALLGRTAYFLKEYLAQLLILPYFFLTKVPSDTTIIYFS
jgi:hypothetical protein